MRKLIIILLVSFSLTGCTLFVAGYNWLLLRSNKQEELKCCSVSPEEMSVEICNRFAADSVVIYSKSLQEELYFDVIKSPVVAIYNATTNTLDFKKLPTSYYGLIEDREEIEAGLKDEGIVVAQDIMNKCDMTKFNDLIIEFLKLDDKGEPLYRFICHYDELLN